MGYAHRGRRSTAVEGGIPTIFRDTTDCPAGGATTELLNPTGKGLFYLWLFHFESIGNNGNIQPLLQIDDNEIFIDNMAAWHDNFSLDQAGSAPLTILAYTNGALIAAQFYFVNGLAFNEQFKLSIKSFADANCEVYSRGYYTTF